MLVSTDNLAARGLPKAVVAGLLLSLTVPCEAIQGTLPGPGDDPPRPAVHRTTEIFPSVPEHVVYSYHTTGPDGRPQKTIEPARFSESWIMGR